MGQRVESLDSNLFPEEIPHVNSWEHLPVVAYLSEVPDMIGAEHLELLQHSLPVDCATVVALFLEWL
jgi:hypothetical protein